VIYLVTPYELSWHLRYSSERLLFHLWPSFLFVYFMIVRTPEEVLSEIKAGGSKEQTC